MQHRCPTTHLSKALLGQRPEPQNFPNDGHSLQHIFSGWGKQRVISSDHLGATQLDMLGVDVLFLEIHAMMHGTGFLVAIIIAALFTSLDTALADALTALPFRKGLLNFSYTEPKLAFLKLVSYLQQLTKLLC